MVHLPDLIKDLALILCSAGVVTLLCKKINQPLVLGYILAGLLVGPHVTFMPSVTDSENVEIWAEIGVIVLLFTLGLEFSFKKLVKVGGTASITASVQIVSMIFLGYLCGQLLGWSNMDSIFLGAILSMSSTTIILRAFDELGVKNMKFAGIVFGALIIEDLVAIVLMVLLSTIAVSQQFAGSEMIMSILKLIFYLMLWFLAGIFIIPTFLKRTKKLMNDETLLVVSLSLCFLMVLLAHKAGFSPALGAFIMGSILAETTQAEKIEHLVKSVKDLFGAVFFVSVGMLIDPKMLVEYAMPIAVITVITIIGKTVSTSAGALISGQPLKQSVQAGMSLAQIGEFSFIIATLGLSLKVTSSFLYPITVAVSAVTTFTTPYMIKLAQPTYKFLERKLPSKWVESLNRYSTGAQHIRGENHWKIVLNSYFQIVGVNSVIIIAIIFLFSKIIGPMFLARFFSNYWWSIITILTALVTMSPFLWTLIFKRINKSSYTHLWYNKFNRGPIVVMELSRVALAVFFTGFLLTLMFSAKIAFIFAVIFIAVAGVIFYRKLQSFSMKIEKRFISNLNARESETRNNPENLSPWDAHLVYLVVSPDSLFTGRTLAELMLRQNFGINIASIERGGRILDVPGADEKIYPYDKIALIGTDEQVQAIKPLIEAQGDNGAQAMENSDIILSHINVTHGFRYLNQSIKASGIREATKGLVVGIERNGERILNPDSSTIILFDDTLWVVGNKNLIKKLIESKNERPLTKLSNI